MQTICVDDSNDGYPPIVWLDVPDGKTERGWRFIMDADKDCFPVAPGTSGDRLKEEIGSWLNALGMWDVYFTGTWSKSVSMDGCAYGVRRYLAWVEKQAGQKPKVFWGVERGPQGGRLHVHGLMGGVAHLKPFCGNFLPPGSWGRSCCLLHGWPWGIARVLVYDPCLGASHYVGKYLVKNLAEWDLQGAPRPAQRPLEFQSWRERVAMARGAGPKKLEKIRAEEEAKRASGGR